MELTVLRGTARVAALLVVVVCVGYALGGCSGVPAGQVANRPAGTPTASPARAGLPSPTAARIGNATAAPRWLGTRALRVGPNGFAAAQTTPPELRNRSIITVDQLPPPPDGRFHATVQMAPASVLARSSWSTKCPVAATDLRYLTVSFRGFDGRAHTGELLVNARAARPLVTVFGQLFAADFPIERMQITDPAELHAAPTGDGNTTEAFVCRPVRGQTAWSQHAYGLAVDVNPFQNPYHRGQVVLPELATSYLNRADERPGMAQQGGPVVRAFAAVGWKWGGDYRSLKDYMHFSANGG